MQENRIADVIQENILEHNPTREELLWILRYGPGSLRKEAGTKLLPLADKEDIMFIRRKLRALTGACAAELYKREDLTNDELAWIVKNTRDLHLREQALEDLWVAHKNCDDLLVLLAYSANRRDDAWEVFVLAVGHKKDMLKRALNISAIQVRAWDALLRTNPSVEEVRPLLGWGYSSWVKEQARAFISQHEHAHLLPA